MNLACLLIKKRLVLATFLKMSREGERVVKNTQTNAVCGKEVRLFLGSHSIP